MNNYGTDREVMMITTETKSDAQALVSGNLVVPRRTNLHECLAELFTDADWLTEYFQLQADRGPREDDHTPAAALAHARRMRNKLVILKLAASKCSALGQTLTWKESTAVKVEAPVPVTGDPMPF